MSEPDEPFSDSSARSSSGTDTPRHSEFTQSPATSIAEGKESRVVEFDEETGRPITPKPASTWPKASKEYSDQQAHAKAKIFVKTDLTTTPAQSNHGSQPPDTEEGSITPVAPNQVPKALTKEEFQKIYQKEAKAMSQRLKVRELQRMLNPTPSNEAQFSEYWEQKLLPKIVEILEANIQGAYHINVRNGHGADQRIIDLVTKGNCAKKYSDLLELAKNETLPEEFRTNTQFDFRGGERVYCVDETDSQAPSQTDLSMHSVVENPHHYDVPVMGDSAGSTSTDGTATLGPLLQIGEKFCRLVNWHMYDDGRNGTLRQWDSQRPPELDLVHPSPDDLQLSPGKQLVEIGKLIAYSGPMYKTSRPITSSDVLANSHPNGMRVTTDWALCETKGPGSFNKIRHVMERERSEPSDQNIIQTASTVKVGDLVYSTGRSSGYSIGKICRRGWSKNEDGTIFRDWAVTSEFAQDNSWHDGMGILGDSGAGIMDLGTHKLIGQLWGRNHYEKEPKEPAMTYFTAMPDIYDDIQARWPGGPCSRPRLPGEIPSTDENGDIYEASTEEGNMAPSSEEGLLKVDSEVQRSSARPIVLINSSGDVTENYWVQHAATWPRVQA